jgi:hypothetical protein
MGAGSAAMLIMQRPLLFVYAGQQQKPDQQTAAL